MAMNTEARRTLSATIRALRTRLLDDLHDATESEYRFSVRARDAGLDEAPRVRRSRLEDWIAEQLRAQDGEQSNGQEPRTADDFRRDAEKQAAYTLLNRLVILRLMEEPGPNGAALRAPAVVTGGWESRAYEDFRQLAPELVRGDVTEGYAFLLRLVFEDLATDLPGLYGPAGVADLIPVPAPTLRDVVDELNKPELETCWSDDMTLGWIYQYWNDPEREALDAKLNAGGKVEPHEIASKTQMFTERYMVDWLLQNSLGPMWLAMCRKHGWTPEVEADGTLDRLEARRKEWRAKRDAGEVSLTALMPLHTDAERCWAYFVPQPIPEDAVTHAPGSVQDLKLIDPAVGSGHFLVVAFGLLVSMYREEARHRGEAGDARWTDRAVVERILEHNLHGIDLDPRAVQIAAAALWLKARAVSPEARPQQLNLVAANLRLSSLPDDDPALQELRREVERETGIPAALTDTIIGALKGADHLGSLLKIDSAVDQALEKMEGQLGKLKPTQADLFTGRPARQQLLTMSADAAKESLLGRLEGFLSKHTSGDDLGLRLRGEQLAAGVRFLRLVKAGAYDLVVANPPYLGTASLVSSKYVKKHYPLGKSDLYATFLLRGLQLTRGGGLSAMLTMRNWMFIQQYEELRTSLLSRYFLRSIGDFDRGAFEDIPDELVSVAVSVFVNGRSSGTSVAVCPTPRADKSRDSHRTGRKRAATLCHVGRETFTSEDFKKIPEFPTIYWWTRNFIQDYCLANKVGDVSPGKFGINLGNNLRFIVRPWEVTPNRYASVRQDDPVDSSLFMLPFSRYLMGAKSVVWCDPVDNLVRWQSRGLEVKVSAEHRYGSYTRKVTNEAYYFRPGVAFSMVGSRFTARLHRWRCIIDGSGSSVYPSDCTLTVAMMNASCSRYILESLNPTISFTVGDVNRLALFPVCEVSEIRRVIDDGFSSHESHREPSVEFTHPGPSPWRLTQDWAQAAVDRPEDEPLPEYIEELDPEPPTDHVSFALGVALGRFGPNREGILDPATADLSHALPAGICFLDGTLTDYDRGDSLGHAAAAPLHAAWKTHGLAIDEKSDLRTWLRIKFFGDVHKSMYENRPIHWPLSSANKTFVAWVNIHRFTDQTLHVLLADHLLPTMSRIEGGLVDLRAARDGGDRKTARTAEKQYSGLVKARDELEAFIAAVEQCADRGALPPDTKCPPREQDARYAPDLDDGVMINSAGLWPLLEPQWKTPKTWWKELASAQGRKDYDWAHLAMRYWPTRVDAKCQKDPSLGVAHGCFWRYHPARAWAWELRLQDEIGPEFRIEETPYQPGSRDLGDGGDGPHRDAWLRDHAEEALAAVEKEAIRRMGRGKARKVVTEMRILEPGLWSARQEGVWDMKLRLSENQAAEFRLLAPDEPEARAAFEAEHPDKVRARNLARKSYARPKGLFAPTVADGGSSDIDDDSEPIDQHEEDDA